MIARQVGEEKFKNFLNKLNLLSAIDFELNEVSSPLNFNWDKCKLETTSFGHGIATTPLQVAAAYASISNGGYKIQPTLIKNLSDSINNYFNVPHEK